MTITKTWTGFATNGFHLVILMKKITASLWAALLASLLLTASIPSTFAQTQDAAYDKLSMNGLARFEQLRKEYYIGALFLESPNRDPGGVIAMPGRKRLALHITADRWPPLRFAQQWNQAILINSDSGTLNANVMDVLTFTSLPKDDLVDGDRLYIDLEPDGGTVVSLNGTVMMRTTSDALFRLVANSWIGPRPPSSDFKKDLLTLTATDPETVDLLNRFEATAPTDTRRKLVAGWAGKQEPAAAVAAATPAPAAARDTAAPVRAESGPATPAPASPPEQQTAARPPAAAAETVASAPATPSPAEIQAQERAAAEARQRQAAEQKSLYETYNNGLRQLVYSQIKYPRRAVEKNIEGLVVLRIETDRSGKLLNLNPAQSAHRLLDKAAMEAVERAAPFPQIAASLQGDSFSFLIPVVFKLTTE
jgi:TonB family protein